jgi:hypothetical protein
MLVLVGVGVEAWACACARVVSLIQHVTRSRHMVCCFSGCTTFRHYLTNGWIEGKKLTKNICFDFTDNFFFKTFPNLSRIKRDIVIKVETSSCKAPVTVIGFQ